ncbi:MAG: hypothetical protein A2V86_03965 [Deltaproteobacteria bacterium RBG_16_49_23]|nr:MAG: hypothetical protein A2V86_03965 [Deltaproteobacteria bacterium RBG_16_49_23]
MNSFRKIMIVLSLLMFLLPFIACKTLSPPPKLNVTVAVTPPQVELAFPGILRVPIVFTGTGWKPKEMVVVDMVLPPGVQMQGVKPGEDVGIAYGEADDAGNFKGEVPASAKLNTFFRVGWTPILAPDPKTLNPIPPGVYKIKASGADSGALATTTLEFAAPTPKK